MALIVILPLEHYVPLHKYNGNKCTLHCRSCEIAIAQGEAENALQKVMDLQSLEQVQSEPRLQVQVLLLHAAALCSARTFSVAVQPLVLAVAEAVKHHLAMLHATAAMMLVRHHLAMMHATAVMILVRLHFAMQLVVKLY